MLDLGAIVNQMDTSGLFAVTKVLDRSGANDEVEARVLEFFEDASQIEREKREIDAQIQKFTEEREKR